MHNAFDIVRFAREYAKIARTTFTSTVTTSGGGRTEKETVTEYILLDMHTLPDGNAIVLVEDNGSKRRYVFKYIAETPDGEDFFRYIASRRNVPNVGDIPGTGIGFMRELTAMQKYREICDKLDAEAAAKV